MGDMLLRLAERIGLLKAAPQYRHSVDPAVPAIDLPVAKIEANEIQKVVDRAAFNSQGSIHVDLTERQTRIERKPPVQAAIVQPDRHTGTAFRIAIAPCSTGPVDDGQFAAPDDGAEKLRQQHFYPPPIFYTYR